MSKGRKIFVGILLLAVIGAAFAAEFLRSETGAEVRVEVIAEREVIATITATGQVRPHRQVNISSDVTGRVTRLTVEEGGEVEQGQILLTVDPSQVEAAVARSRASLSQTEAQAVQQRANLAQAERELARLLSLRDQVTAQSIEEAQTRLEVQRALVTSGQFGVEQAQAALREAEEQLSKTTIRSPISGRVTRLNIREGETAVVGTMNNAGSLLLTVSDLSEIEVVLSVDETDVPLISVGDSTIVQVDALPGRSFAGRVSRIGSSSIQAGGGTAQQSVNFEVVVTLLDPPATLRPDLSATADIIVERRDRVPAVPIISVTVRPDPEDSSRQVEGVFLVREGIAHWTPVEIGVTGQEYFEVLSGLRSGDTVVAGPFQTIRELQDGNEVRLAPAGTSRSAPAAP